MRKELMLLYCIVAGAVVVLSFMVGDLRLRVLELEAGVVADTLPVQLAAPILPPDPFAVLVRAALEAQVPAHLVLAVAQVESQRDSVAVSRRGAVGLMQIMPQYHTVSTLALCGELWRLVEMDCNARVGTHYLYDLYTKHGTWRMALFEYVGAILDGQVRYLAAGNAYVAAVDSALAPGHKLFDD